RHAQKMDALGQLTAGIAHNFNNMLTVILSNLQLGIPNASDPTRARLKDADHAARRAADMVRELMVFARRHPAPSKLPVDTREILLRTREICRTTFDKSIEIVVDIDGAAQPDGMLDGFSVLGDPGQLEQVLLNICLNARDALEMRPAGTPGASRIELLLRARPAADGGGRNGLCIEVRDNGPGMSEDVRRRIFEPFFTTKEIGRGTGLGLATAYGIVTDHGGTIECDSRPGEGSTFRVWLPSDATPDAARAAHEAAQPKRETVLLVEDDDMVRRTTCAVLESGGYDVLQAENGEDAIALYRREAARIRLVVLDWTMPRVSGERVLEELVRFSSDVRVVLFSGQYPGGKLPSNVRGIVQKPAPVESLLATVRNALDS
ncbi:MAG TPA: ATP-binding protein, partial [Polyangiales bacterium]|nr:ATP-binding protein [Polyangiales bacterium]